MDGDPQRWPPPTAACPSVVEAFRRAQDAVGDRDRFLDVVTELTGLSFTVDSVGSKLEDRLLGAVCRGDCAEVAELVAAGADVNVRVPELGWTSVNFAIEHDHPAVLRLLLAAGATPHTATDNGWTPLHHAVDAETDFSHQAGTPLDLRLIRPLVDAGADVHGECHHDGRVTTPVDMARRWGYTEALDLMEGDRR